jgi:hypothetical protein
MSTGTKRQHSDSSNEGKSTGDSQGTIASGHRIDSLSPAQLVDTGSSFRTSGSAQTQPSEDAVTDRLSPFRDELKVGMAELVQSNTS